MKCTLKFGALHLAGIEEIFNCEYFLKSQLEKVGEVIHYLLHDDKFAHSSVVECAFMLAYSVAEVSSNSQDLVRIVNHEDELCDMQSSILWVSQKRFENLSNIEKLEKVTVLIVEEVTSKFFESKLENVLVA